MAEYAKRDVGKDHPFKAAMKAVDELVHLGDVKSVENLLRFYASEFADRSQGPADPLPVITKLARRLAKILLGEDPAYSPMYRWNQPGVIDEYCAKALGSSENTPLKVMEHCVMMFFEELSEVAVIAGTDGVLEEEWGWKVEAVLEKFTNAFVGLSPATASVMLPDVVVYNDEQDRIE